MRCTKGSASWYCQEGDGHKGAECCLITVRCGAVSVGPEMLDGLLGGTSLAPIAIKLVS